MKKLIYGLIAFLFIAGTYFVFKPQSPVHIAYMIDSKYLPYMMVSLNSAIKNKQKNTVYHVHVIAKDFTLKDEEKLQKMASEKIKIKIYPAEEQYLDISHLGRFAVYSIALQKLFIPDYLKQINKVLYLDADTLVLKDLSEVYKTELADNYVAAVKDGLMFEYPEHIVETGLEWRNFYFNSGIMLLNLQKIREDKIKRKALIYYNTHQDIFGDQDVLNVVFRTKILSLSYRYNCISKFFEERDAKFLSEFYGEFVPQSPEEVYKNAAILHFAGHKPWTEWYDQKILKNLWYEYANEVITKIK